MNINRSAEVVFDYCSDPSREPEWNPKLRHVTKLRAGPVGVGTRYELVFGPGDPMLVECVRFERPVVWSTVGESRRLSVSFEGRVDPTTEGVRLSMRMALTPKGLLRLVAPLLRRSMQAQLMRDLTTIKALLEERLP